MKLFNKVVRNSETVLGSGKIRRRIASFERRQQVRPIGTLPVSRKDMVNRLSVLVGEHHAGNDSNELKNELSALIDQMHKKKIITASEHQGIHKEVFLKIKCDYII